MSGTSGGYLKKKKVTNKQSLLQISKDEKEYAPSNARVGLV